MFKAYKVFIHRVIGWLVERVKGDTLEERLMSVIKIMTFTQALFLSIVISMGITIFNDRIRIADTDHAAEAIKKIFDPKTNPIDQFARVNSELNNKNLMLTKDNLGLSETNNFLLQQNKLYRLEIGECKKGE